MSSAMFSPFANSYRQDSGVSTYKVVWSHTRGWIIGAASGPAAAKQGQKVYAQLLYDYTIVSDAAAVSKLATEHLGITVVAKIGGMLFTQPCIPQVAFSHAFCFTALCLAPSFNSLSSRRRMPYPAGPRARRRKLRWQQQL
jgi:hypothetical protein